jgi:hypothetical protein
MQIKMDGTWHIRSWRIPKWPSIARSVAVKLTPTRGRSCGPSSFAARPSSGLPVVTAPQSRGAGNGGRHHDEVTETFPTALTPTSVRHRRSDGDGRYGLRITQLGLKAIGVPALESGPERPTATPAATPRPGSKQARLIALLMQPNGKSIDELSQAFGWLTHSTRAVISRLQKSGHVVVRTKGGAGQSLYRIEAPAEATASDLDA